MWIPLIIVAVILLVIFWRGPNAIWGGITFGLIIGLIVAIINSFLGKGFHWSTIGKVTIICVLIGGFFEIIGKLSGRKRIIK